jgi:hypothetical protein
MTVAEMPTASAERHVLRVELAHATDMFETPTLELGSTIGGFTPGIDRCIADLAAHPEEKGVRLEIALPPGEITLDLAEKMTVTLGRCCSERAAYNASARSATIRSGLRAFRIGLPVTIVGLAITAGATKIGDIDDAVRAVVDILGWVLAWVGLWYPFDKILFYPLDNLRENRALATLGRAHVSVVPLTEEGGATPPSGAARR